MLAFTVIPAFICIPFFYFAGLKMVQIQNKQIAEGKATREELDKLHRQYTELGAGGELQFNQVNLNKALPTKKDILLEWNLLRAKSELQTNLAKKQLTTNK